MSEVASLELCKELYEQSGWNDTPYNWYTTSSYNRDGRIVRHRRWFPEPLTAVEADEQTGINQGDRYLAAYDLGYLLRKLPKEVDETTPGVYWDRLAHVWAADYGNDMEYRQEADTPEDAAAKLAIELFKQGILTRDGDVA